MCIRDRGGGSGGNPGGGPAVAPTAVTGISLQFHDGADVNRLEFQTASSGIDFDDSAPSQFTYTYAPDGGSSASLVVRFKVDKWDEYDLTFTGDLLGSYVRREFKDSVLEDTDSGRFERPTAP